MTSLALKLYQARDAEASYAIALEGDPAGTWRARSGFGQDFEKIWGLELQSEIHPEVQTIEWESVLDRAIEAYNLSDPVITNFIWPQGISR